jgi:phosphoglycerol transferase MdoB-like AlkP superfamily enzyme
VVSASTGRNSKNATRGHPENLVVSLHSFITVLARLQIRGSVSPVFPTVMAFRKGISKD